jgi:flagellar biosynthesis chaperone FliJ
VTLRNKNELTNTQAKLDRLEARYTSLRDQTGGDEELREATMESLKRFINQLKEEIARFNASRHAAK